MIHIDRVSKTYYRNGRPVAALSDVSLSVSMGQFVAVLGGRGAGKSTLMRIAAGLERPDSGHVSIDGRRIDQMTDKELTKVRRMDLSCVWSSAPPLAEPSHETSLLFLCVYKPATGAVRLRRPTVRWRHWKCSTVRRPVGSRCLTESASLYPSPGRW
ncbi:MAG: ATP-binding cassette domain-containing protein [Actinobacteria bacterium]|nr:ATP-binding cassette domain-containing protein [Actinomycetota bacterium]